MQDTRARDLMGRHEKLASGRANWESLWEECAKRYFPRGDDFRSKHAKGATRTDFMYDSAPVSMLNRGASATEAGLTPRNAVWFVPSSGDSQIDEIDSVKRYNEDAQGSLHREMYRPQANFASQMFETYLSLFAFGTGCIYTEPHPMGGVVYRAPHLSQMYFAQNAYGIVDVVNREFTLTHREALQLFGDDTPDKIKEKVDGPLSKPGSEFETARYLHCVMPREDYDETRLGPSGMPIAQFYVCMDHKCIVKEGGYHEMPYAVARYVTSPSEVYGRSPGITHLPDVKMLNEMAKTTIEAAELTVDPPVLLHDDSILNDFSLRAGANNYGAVDDQGRQLAVPWQSGADLGLGMEMIERVRNQIDDGFLGAYFRVLRENPQMTATQALLVAQTQGQLMAPVIGRLQTELLSPIIRRTAGILTRQGRMPEPPPELIEYLQAEQADISIEYQSPMVRLADAERGIGILRTFEGLAPLAQANPEKAQEIFAKFNFNKIAEILAEVNGMPAEAMYSDEEIEGMEEQQQAANDAAQLLEAAPIAAQTAKTLAEAQAIGANVPGPQPEAVI